ncbi:MAG: HAMP domain-containing protein [Actinobacteria bacterium]|uniref:histidine kinase n=1 Tax=freshwater metagenome TaxID=449393 RepID=A0A6J6P3R3_9ZZZZ|nr:HAMP domain-containing protein [Actinomycetota bacterium]MSY26633.1 HAMP domain-containing protein [Actinomycetota bacterium]MSZ86878.1 HAMP domain-containing protein [Actinomycetota bacterium]MTB13981.1 HAMP domain-containing protein [Actinomycetota bacterium]MTB24707.1 HAMP domain-containing protein [Actinomycetota bacterium]
MKLRTRLTLISSIFIALASICIGVFSVTATRQSSLTQIDNTLTQVLNASDGGARRAQGSVVARADDLNVAIALGLVLPDQSITVVRRAGDITNPYAFPTLNKSEILNAGSKFTNVDGEVPYRIRSRSLGDGVALMAAAPLVSLNSDLRQLVIKTTVGALFIIFLSALLVWFSTRRALRTVDAMIDSASAIADGELDRKVPEAHSGTELGRLASALNVMIASLRSSLRAKDESEQGMRRFLGDASHELRTPLTVIKGYGEILKDAENLDPVQRSRAIDRLNAESARMDTLISDLLRLSRLDQHPVISAELVDLSSATSDFARDLQDQEVSRNVELQIEEDVIVRGDESLLRQVLANIMGNIRRHTPADSPVRVRLSLDGENGSSMAHLVVDDAGPGISPEQREIALARFGRLEESRSRQGGGFGLGLSIVAQVVALHQGELKLGTSPLGGLRLEILIPGVTS